MKRGLVTSLAVALLVLSTAASADQHKNLARGLSNEVPYHVDGIENVNMYNGNLTIAIPLGIPYHVGGNLTYQFGMVYNSKVWDYKTNVYGTQASGEPYCCDDSKFVESIPNQSSNAGLGWSVTLGTLNALELNKWVFTTPDGATHMFDDAPVTTDTSYLRMRSDGTTVGTSPVAPTWVDVDLQNGTTYHFIKVGSGYPLDSIADVYGNQVKLTPEADGSVQVTDRVAGSSTDLRTHIIRFTSGNSIDAPPNYDQLVSDLELQGPPVAEDGGSRTIHYAFHYDTTTRFQYGCGDSLPQHTEHTTNMLKVPALTSVTLPDGTNYSFGYNMVNTNPDAAAEGISSGCESGTMTFVHLPTGGEFRYQYSLLKVIPAWCQGMTTASFSAALAVKEHWPGSSGTGPDTWTYTRVKEGATKPASQGSDVCWIPAEFARRPPPYSYQEQLKVTLANPDGTSTRSYFSIWPDAYASPNGFVHEEFGLPFTRHIAGQGELTSVRKLSTQDLDGASQVLRETRVEYDFEDNGAYTSNPRVRESSECFSSTQCRETVNSDWDGFGHYRHSESTVNWSALPRPAGSALRISNTDYNAGRTSFTTAERWILGTYTTSSVTEGSATATSEVCMDLGAVTRQRTYQSLSAATRGTNDLLVAYTRDSKGDVTHESYFGGDTQMLATTALCSLILPAAPQYGLTHTYAYGAEATSQYDGASTYPSFENTIDLSGLPTTKRDVSGVATNVKYDHFGRVRFLEPAAGSWIEYRYTPASVSTPFKIEILARANQSESGSTYLAKESVELDPFGRPVLEKRLMPGGIEVQRSTTYDSMGRKSKVSEWDLTPSHFTFFTYDALGRVIRVRPPDVSGGDAPGALPHDVLTTYDGAATVQKTVTIGTSSSLGAAESSSTTTETHDAAGRLVAVAEPSGTGGASTTTTYGYDVANHLTSVSTTALVGGSPVSQSRTFTYDGRGFLLAEHHPEKDGDTAYSSFDARGHAGAKAQNGTTQLTYQYDFMERLTHVNDASNARVKEFVFGGDNGTGASDYRRGKLRTAIRDNRLPTANPTVTDDYTVTDTYVYGAVDGAMSAKTTTVTHGSTPVSSFTQHYDYDALGEATSISYPDCGTNCTPPASAIGSLSQSYDVGYLVGVAGFGSLKYHPTGMLKSVVHGQNGGADVADTYDADPNGMARPAAIRFSGYTRECVPPTAPVINGPSAVCVGVTSSASTAQQGSATYLWTISGGSIAGSANGSSVSFVAAAAGTVTLSLRVRSSCGPDLTTSTMISAASRPSATLSSATTTVSDGTILSVAVTGTSSYELTWSDGQTTTSATRKVSPTCTTTYGLIAIRDTTAMGAGCSGTVSGTAVVTAAGGAALDPPVITTSAAHLCLDGGSVLFSTQSQAGSSYTWEITGASGVTPSANAVIFVPSQSVVTLKVTVTNGCSSASSTITATFSPVPTATIIGSTSIVAGGTAPITATLSGTPPFDVTWNDLLSESVSTSSYSRLVAPTSTTHYSFNLFSDATFAETGCYGVVTGGADISICAAPTISAVSADQIITSGAAAGAMSVTALGSGTLSYQWYRGDAPDVSIPVGTNSASFTDGALTSGRHYWVRVTNSCGGATQAVANSPTIKVDVRPPTPTGVVATFLPVNGTNMVRVTWSGGGSTFAVDRRELRGGTVTTFGGVTASPFFDITVVPGKAYLYSVRRIDVVSSFSSAEDLATAIFFTDDPVQTSGVRTLIRGNHFVEARQAIDGVRVLAGLPRGWTSYAAMTGPIHFSDLSTNALGTSMTMIAALNEALTLLGRSTVSYTTAPALGGTVRAEHIQVLREGVR